MSWVVSAPCGLTTHLSSRAMNAEAATRLTGLCRRFSLSEEQELALAAILGELAADDQAPTSVRSPERAIDVHLADSLAALTLDAVRSADTIVDIGAGAGFPGLPLAVALHNSQVVLVDSQARKCRFVERMREAAQIGNARVLCTRAEEWPEGIGAHDVVVARAVGPQPVVLEYAAPLLRLGGALIDWRGARNAQEEQLAVAAAEQLGMEREAVHRVEPYEGARDHHLHVYVKRRETPDRFPRRVGMARKRPLG